MIIDERAGWDPLARIMERARDAITDPETRAMLEEVAAQLSSFVNLDDEVPAEVVEKLEYLKERLHNEPEAVDALQTAIDRCKEPSHGSGVVKGAVLGAILTAAVGGVLYALTTK